MAARIRTQVRAWRQHGLAFKVNDRGSRKAARVRSPPRWTLLFLLSLVTACGGPPPPAQQQPPDDSGIPFTPDAGEPPDAGVPDAGIEPPDAGPIDAGVPDAGVPLSISVSSGELVPAFSPEVTSYELTSFTLLQPVTVTVEGAFNASVDGVKVENGMPYLVSGKTITSGQALSIELDDRTYTVQLYPTTMPPLTVTELGSLPGTILLSPGRYLLILDHTGELLFYRRCPGQVWDFRRHELPGGVIRYSYVMDGDAYVLDQDFNPVETFHPLATSTHPDYQQDDHDFLMLGPEHVIMTAYVPRTVTNIPSWIPQPPGGANVVAGFVQEVDDGGVVFEWDSTDHPELYELSTEGNDFLGGGADYAHLNSVDLDPSDGNLILSFRHLDCVLKVDRHTGDILWRLGGHDDSFDTSEDQLTSHQHSAHMIGPNRLQLFDNGVASGASRILTYDLDPVNGRIAGFRAFDLGYFAFAMGSVQQLTADRMFVGLGLNGPTVPDAIEYDLTTGKPTFVLSLPPNLPNYRAYKYP